MQHEKLAQLARERHFYVIGLGSVARAMLPLIFRELGLASAQVTIIAPQHARGFEHERYGHFECVALTRENYLAYLAPLKRGDVVLNLANEVSSCDLIKLSQARDAIYLDTVIEPWDNWYDNPALSANERTNYALREQALELKGKSTAVLTHGANPGLVSHFAKMAILDVARQQEKFTDHPVDRHSWATLAQAIDLRVIHIAEYDSQFTHRARAANHFFNTWSVAGFVAEAGQPAELGWGTHEKRLPPDAARHTDGCGAAIYINRPGAGVRVKSWVPGIGAYHGFLVTHGESISLADYFTLSDKQGRAVYRPTVHYAYRPCDAAVASLHDLSGRQWQTEDMEQHIMLHDIIGGADTLGVLLGYGEKGSYWYGSRLTVEQARTLCPEANATSLQVAAGVLGALVWALENPARGVVEPEEMDSGRVLDIARPYLGELFGEHSNWTPLAKQNALFQGSLDAEDPWQFSNIRVEY